MNKLNFKYLFPNLFLFCICMNLTACSEKNSGGDNLQSGDEIISFEPDLNTLIRNPASGWTLYDDANDYVAQANTYWNQQGAAAEKYASIFYCYDVVESGRFDYRSHDKRREFQSAHSRRP